MNVICHMLPHKRKKKVNVTVSFSANFVISVLEGVEHVSEVHRKTELQKIPDSNGDSC